MNSQLYICNIEALDTGALYDRAYLLASEERKRKVDLLHFKDDKKRSLSAELLLRNALNDRGIKNDELLYDYNEFGKPYLKDHKDFFFSISHSFFYVILACSDREIGCDIEKVRDIDINKICRSFQKEEYQDILKIEDLKKRRVMFFRYWTLKESFIKYLSYGLSVPLDSYHIEINNGNIGVKQDLTDRTLCFNEIRSIPDYCIGICSEDQEIESKTIDLQSLLQNI